MTTLPANISGYLERFARRRRRVVLLRAAGLSVVFGVCWILLWCLIDRLVPLPAALRAVGLAVGAGAIAVMLWRPVAASMRRLDLVQAAQEVEARTPAFDERLETVTSQLAAPAAYRGSGAMLEQLVRQVGTAVDDQEPHRLAPWSPALRPWVAVAGLAALVVALWPFQWLDLPRLMVRFTLPVAQVMPVTTTRISAWHEPERIIEGERVTISAQATDLGDGGLVLRYGTDGRTWTARPMPPTGDGFALTLPAMDRSFSYVVEGGDGRTAQTQVRVLRRPRVESYRIRYDYPGYMQREPLTVASDDGLVEAPVGTHVTIAIAASGPLKHATLSGRGEVIETAATPEAAVRQATLEVKGDRKYALRLVSAQDVEGVDGAQVVVRGVPDQRPLARWIEPAEDLRLTPRDVLAVRFQAMDDHGLRSLRIVATVNEQERQSAALRLRGDRRRQEGLIDLDLATLEAEYGDVVALRLVVEDEAGQEGLSETRSILITPRSIDMSAYARLAELATVAELAEALLQTIDHGMEARRGALASRDDFEEWMARAEYDQHLLAASETAVLLRQSLMRALVHTAARSAGDVLADQVDAGQRVSVWADDLARREVDAPEAEATLQAMRDVTRALGEQIETMLRGERAAAALAGRVNVGALEERAARTGEEAVKRTAERAREELQAAIREIGLDPAAGDLERRLEQLIAAAGRDAEARQRVDFVEAAQRWAQGEGVVPVVALVARLGAAAQAEAVRPGGDLLRARDLQLTATAATALEQRPPPEMGPGTGWEAAALPPELAALVREHELRQTVAADDEARGSPLAAEAIEIADAAAQARERMRAWAAMGPVEPRGPEAAGRLEQRLALEAAAETALRRYDRAIALDAELERLQRRSAWTSVDRSEAAEGLAEPPSGDAGEAMGDGMMRDGATGDGAMRRALVRRATETARQLDEIAARQAAVARETEALRRDAREWMGLMEAERASDLEGRQAGVAEAIDVVRRGVHDPLELVADEQQRSSREEVMAAMQAAQERLAALPGQLSEAQQQGQRDRAAREAVARARQDLRAAADDAREPIQRVVAQAEVAAGVARARTEAVAGAVAPEVSEAMAVQLQVFEPTTSAAVMAIEQGLTPALRTLRQGIESADAAVTNRAVRDARAAVRDVQDQLRLAQGELAQRDPLVAAQWFARQAAVALAMRPPDYEAATHSQGAATTALARAWQESAARANRHRLSGAAGFAALYDLGIAAQVPGAIGGAEGGAFELPAAREWGRVRRRDHQDLTVGGRDADPPGYGESLRAYFEALGASQRPDPADAR